MEMAKIGPGIAGGNNRQTLTDEDGEGRHLFKRWCEAAGLEMGLDEMGTMFARREGTDPACRRSMSAAISTRSRPAASTTACSACSAGWKSSARSTISASRQSIRSSSSTGPTRKARASRPAMMASGVFAGVYTRTTPTNTRTRTGRSSARSSKRIGWKGDETVGDAQDPRLLRAAYRAGADPRGRGHRHRRRHPRAGPEMAAGDADRQGGAYRLDADAEAPQCRARHGAGDRTGARDRHGLPARRRRRGRPHGGLSRTRATSSPARPSSPSTSARRRRKCWTRWTAASAKASTRSARRSTSSTRSSRSAISIRSTFDQDCVKAIRDAAERLGYSHRNIVSGAGHDACWINRVAPTAMVMCPCVDGLSHNEAEEIYQGMGRAPAPTCCSTRWWRRR